MRESEETFLKKEKSISFFRRGRRFFIGIFFLFFLGLFFYLCTSQSTSFAYTKALGCLLLSTVFTALGRVCLKTWHRSLFASSRHLALLATLVILTLFLAKATERFFLSQPEGYLSFSFFHVPLFVPFTSIFVCVLIGMEAALVTAFFLTAILGAFLHVDPAPFFTVNFLAACVTILAASRIHKRNEVFTVLGKTWLSSLPLLLAFSLVNEGGGYPQFLKDCISTFIFLLGTSVLVACILPLFESLFRVMTVMKLREYFDPSHELLRRLNLEAPGTYQHSLVVGNLAEIAAQSIGADALFCRVATLYHDIGKLLNPHYFSENQGGGVNMHQLLTPLESANVIIAHVKEGERLARKYRLPQSFIDIIREHHGTTLVSCFYHKEMEQKGEQEAREAEKSFRYAGPKPRTKESGLIMLVDTIEAASRSLEEVTEESLTEMVSRLIAKKIEEGQFDECHLTFEDLSKVKKALVHTLVVARHVRVKYPASGGL